MKNIIILIFCFFTYSVFSHEIEGTLILRGSIKTKITVNGINTTCKAKVEKVKNLLEEDSYGNPAYKVLMELSLNGKSSDNTRVIKSERDVWFDNLFTVSADKKEVRDFEYKSSTVDAFMKIDKDGRIKEVRFPFNNQSITCLF